MKNIEKYTNTKDALEAYNSIANESIPFDEWLKSEYEDPSDRTLLEAAAEMVYAWTSEFKPYYPARVSNAIIRLSDAIDREKRKPVRNCDRLSADKCKQILKREMEVYLPQEATDNDRKIAQLTAYGVIDALFAPYTEHKGETDGSN